ncbi:MAG: hypothetical protein IJ721_08265, partial [Bacteroidales bacterium]|nr:hypothetical protein [Bacteroidales bacterium]
VRHRKQGLIEVLSKNDFSRWHPACGCLNNAPSYFLMFTKNSLPIFPPSDPTGPRPSRPDGRAPLLDLHRDSNMGSVFFYCRDYRKMAKNS